MDRTQSEILIVTVIGILLVLIFGSPIRRKVRVKEVAGTEQHGDSPDSESNYPHVEKLKIVGRDISA